MYIYCIFYFKISTFNICIQYTLLRYCQHEMNVTVVYSPEELRSRIYPEPKKTHFTISLRFFRFQFFFKYSLLIKNDETYVLRQLSIK